MTADLVLHERNTFAFNSVHNDDGRFALDGLGTLDGGQDSFDVMTVAGQDVPAEGFPLGSQIHIAGNIFNGAVDLQMVVIDESHQVVQFIVSREHSRFPDLAFFDLAVAQQAVGCVIFIVQLGAESNTVGNRDALAQRARGNINARALV